MTIFGLFFCLITLFPPNFHCQNNEKVGESKMDYEWIFNDKNMPNEDAIRKRLAGCCFFIFI